jgi:signal transduction histidine kinase
VHAAQIVLNLLLNALDSAAGGVQPRARLRIEVDAGHGMLTVTDSGPGVAPEHQARLFEPFFTTTPGGLGLGLSVSQTLAEAQGGRLWYEPAAGNQPHAFRFVLPIAAADA